MNIDLKNPSNMLPSNVKQLLVMALAEGYRPEMTNAAIKELGELLARMYVKQVVDADPRHATPALDATLDRAAGDNFEQTEIACAELAKLRQIIKDQQEQMARTEKVLDDSVQGVKQVLAWNKCLDKLQAENKALREDFDRYQKSMGKELADARQAAAEAQAELRSIRG